MTKTETILLVVVGALVIIFSALFLPVFFVILASIGLIWFFIARGTGYLILSYLALIIGVVLLILTYPFDHSSGESLSGQAKQLAFQSGAVRENKPVVLKKLDGEGKDAVFLVANSDFKKATLLRLSTQSYQNYSIKTINKETGQSNYDPSVSDSPQNKFMLVDFKNQFPLKYGIAFALFLLPLLIVASLPSRRKDVSKFVFNSSDGRLSSWLLPSGPSHDATGSVGAAGTQLILVVTAIMAIAFFISMPSLIYLF